MHTLQEKPSGNLQGYLIKWQAMTKNKIPLFPLQLSHKGKNKGKYISFH
jgi:hypothetical protein